MQARRTAHAGARPPRLDAEAISAHHGLSPQPPHRAQPAGSELHRRREDVSNEVYYAATLASCLIGDCGPCTQLVVTMALREGVPRETLENVVRGSDLALDEDVRLAVRFVRASLARVPEADGHRERVVERWGRRGLLSLTFALLVAQIYPIVKYALGHGQTCQRVVFDMDAIPVATPRVA